MEGSLFNQVLSILFKTQGQDDRTAGIRIFLEHVTVTSPIHRKELRVRLTDDQDPFFLYDLHLGEEDFQVLKSQQGLLVDFSAFPQKFIELLQLCAKNQGQEQGKFVLQLSQSGGLAGVTQGLAQLSVIETNPFKHLTHLSLSFKPGSDSEVKQYLAKCLKSLQEDHRQLKAHLSTKESSLTQQLQHTQESLQSRSSELERLRAQWSSQSDSLEAKHQQELAEERQKALEMQRDVERQSSGKQQELEEKNHKQTDKMTSRIAELQAVNREMHERRQAQESTIKELRSKLHMAEEDYQRAQRELQSSRRHTERLETEHTDREQTVGQLSTRVAVLEQEVRDQRALADKSAQLLQAASDNKAQLEESMQQKQSLLVKLESTVKSTSKEVLKGNEIIRKLQGELKAAMAKMKLRNTVTSKQEKLLEERSQMLHSTQEERDNLRKTCDSLESQNERLKESLERTTSKLEESKEILKTNENVINWLNKQVNEAHLSQRHGTFEPQSRPPPITSYKPGTVPYQPPGAHPGPPTTTTSQSAYGHIPRHALTSTPASNPSVPLSTPHSGLSAITHTSQASPALDPKYLQRQQDPPLPIGALPPRGSRIPTSSSAGLPRPPIPAPLSQTHPPAIRGRAPSASGPRGGLTQNKPADGGGQAQPPLMSSYFPRSMQTAS